MAVANPREVPEYELNPLELHIRKRDGITKVVLFLLLFVLLFSIKEFMHGTFRVELPILKCSQ